MSDTLAEANHSMGNENGKERFRVAGRRRFLATATSVVGLAGVAVATWPFLESWNPSARARSIGAPVQLDVSLIKPGQLVAVKWQGKPVWVLHRTKDMLERMEHPHWLEHLADPDSQVKTQQPAYARNPTRSIRPEILVVIAVCTHLGCIPIFRPELASPGLGEDWMGGFHCPCHGSKFDLAGRVFKAVPAPTNLVIPPYRYLEGNLLEIGTG